MIRFLKNILLLPFKIDYWLINKIGNSNHPQPLEGILRPALEMNIAIIAFLMGLLVLNANILFSDHYAYVASIFFFGFAFIRFYQARYIMTYKRYIKKLKPYKISVKDLYRYIDNRGKDENVFVGMGFRWNPKHSQRFFDLETVAAFDDYTSKEKTKLGGKAHLHGVGAMEEVPVFINNDDRTGHLGVYGQSRVGKSRLIELIIEQDIAAGKCVFLIDPKSDVGLLKRFLLAAERSNRLDDVMILHLGFLAESIKYNPVKTFQRVTEVASRIASKLSDGGDSGVFAEFAWRFLYIAASAMEKLGETPSINSLKKCIKSFDHLFVRYTQHFLKFTDEEFKSKVLSKVVDRKLIAAFLVEKTDDTINTFLYLETHHKNNLDELLEDIISAYSYGKTYYDKITASLLPFLDKLSSLDEITSNYGQEKCELILEEAIKGNKLVFLGLDSLTDNKVASAFGAMFFADLVSTAGKLYKEQETFNDVIIHADEFNDVISDDFIPLVNKAGGVGIKVCAYTQVDDDIDLGFGGNQAAKTKANVVKGNFRTIAMMRVARKDTANFFGERFSKTNVQYSSFSTSISDSDSETRGTSASSGDTINHTEIPLIEDSAIMSQPVGQIFFSLNGNNIYHVRIPLIDEDLTGTIGNIEEDEGGLGKLIKLANTRQLKLKKKDVISAKTNNPNIVPNNANKKHYFEI
jgi:conjugative coupling factor TraD (SXT/TOL subfamily)